MYNNRSFVPSSMVARNWTSLPATHSRVPHLRIRVYFTEVNLPRVPSGEAQTSFLKPGQMVYSMGKPSQAAAFSVEVA